MKLIILFIGLINSIFYFRYNNKIIDIENVIHSLYINDFYEYLTFDIDCNLLIDEDKLEEYLSSYGYEVIVRKENGNLIINIGFKYIIEFQKEYSFYVVKNDE